MTSFGSTVRFGDKACNNGVGQSKPIFQVEGNTFRPIFSVILYPINCSTTLPLEVFTKWNFVADFIRSKLNFIPKNWKIGIWATLWGLRCNVCTPSMARWKAHIRFSIRHNWTFFHYVLCLRLYKCKSVEVGIFRRGGSLSANISDGRRQFPATPVGLERLEISLFHMVLRYWQTIISFSRNTCIWQTDGQTDRIAIAIQCIALHAVTW